MIRFFFTGDTVLVEDESLQDESEMVTLYFPEEDAYADVSRFSFAKENLQESSE